ncbi:MAG: hypothetical protein H6679_02505 [Epsilonproteobacteria bacterium]|nr:hypothetical protein [Campylobacterota bacterium]
MQTSNKSPQVQAIFDIETLIQAAHELNELEKHLIQNWSTMHTTLYNLLDGIMKQHLASLSCTAKPDIFIIFAGIQNHQAEAQLMVNGATRIIIGAQFMRETILKVSAPNHSALVQQFN